MFLDRKGLRVFIYRSEIDMRCGFERLHSYCVHQMQAQMDQGHVYFFFGKNRKRVKLLVYDGSGLVLIAKRIERGQFMSHAELLGRNEITHDELKLIMHGSVIQRVQPSPDVFDLIGNYKTIEVRLYGPQKCNSQSRAASSIRN